MGTWGNVGSGAAAGSVAGPVGAVVGAGIGAFASIFGAKKQAHANTSAAKLQADAAHQALDYQRQQAAREQANFESTQHANYDQWAAKEHRLGSLGQLVGLRPREIPAYVPTTANAMLSAPIDYARPQQFRRGTAGQLIQD